ncbi:hypothetical protein GCM10010169_55710 [Micromonospora fulviviridis]|uniref:hypothetical protein n=1 Tax=Micromonospora fulviviridis TaxID=47860 RepID=UPI001663BC21|nr:hypothetical protein [Micromonospora fulviviridis]GGS03800.1 hypothetical protein GCM10010169_55710 [Micromonospora fulviviridis]
MADEVDRDYTAAHDFPMLVPDDSIDTTLASLVDMAEYVGDAFEVGLLLLVPGGAIHGNLVSKKRWYAEWFAGIGGGAGSIGRIFRVINEAAGKMADDGSVFDHTGVYVHILDGCLLNPQGQTNRMPWRIKLNQVTAWSLGAATGQGAEQGVN